MTTQLAHPTGKARVRLTLLEGTVVEGEIVWADATLLKLRGEGAMEGVIVPKHHIKTLEALDGTELTSDVAPDRWGERAPEHGLKARVSGRGTEAQGARDGVDR